jgi:hypothetical protein
MKRGDSNLITIRQQDVLDTITAARKYVRLSSLTDQAGQAGKPDVHGFLSCRSTIGKLSRDTMDQIDVCLKAALALS